MGIPIGFPSQFIAHGSPGVGGGGGGGGGAGGGGGGGGGGGEGGGLLPIMTLREGFARRVTCFMLQV